MILRALKKLPFPFIEHKRKLNPFKVIEPCDSMLMHHLLLCCDICVLQVFRIKPPMCITEADAQFGIDVIRSALQKHSM